MVILLYIRKVPNFYSMQLPRARCARCYNNSIIPINQSGRRDRYYYIVLLYRYDALRYPYASLNRTLFWTERSAASWHAPGIFVLYVYLAVFYRASRDRDLNSIPKCCDTPMARGSRIQRGTIGNRSEASRWNFVETSWQLRSEWSRMWKPF